MTSSHPLPARMQAIEVLEPGGPEKLLLTRKAIPTPGPGALLIRVRASGVNFADILCRESRHPGMKPPPLIPGCEAGGDVVEVGAGVTRFKRGDPVAVYSPFGGSYAEFMTAPENYCLPRPPGMSALQGAAFCHVFLTAFHALQTLGRARQGERALITAAAGGVGTALLQIAAVLGLKTTAAVGSVAKLKLVEGLGIDQAHCYGAGPDSLDPDKLGQFDLILESVGGAVFQNALRLLAPLGRVVVFGFASGEASQPSPFDLLPLCASYATLNLSVIFAQRPDLVRDSWVQLCGWFGQGRLRPMIHHQFPLAEAAQAHRLMQSRQSTGKILLLPGEA